jgi:hypothetical protein
MVDLEVEASTGVPETERSSQVDKPSTVQHPIAPISLK